MDEKDLEREEEIETVKENRKKLMVKKLKERKDKFTIEQEKRKLDREDFQNVVAPKIK